MVNISVRSFEPERVSAVLSVVSDETSPPTSVCVRVPLAAPGGQAPSSLEFAGWVRNYNERLRSKTLDQAVRALGGSPVECPAQSDDLPTNAPRVHWAVPTVAVLGAIIFFAANALRD